MKLSATQILIIIVIVVLIFITIGIWFYRKGKKTTTIKEPPSDNPFSDGAVNNPAGVSSGEITSIANALHTDMDGFNWSGHNADPFQKFNSLSDTDFVKVYNAFNTMYQADSGETLREWIDSESFAFDDIIESIITRMNRLNLI